MKRIALIVGSASCALLAPVAAIAGADKPELAAPGEFARFAPRADTVTTKLDFSYWDKALRWFVLRMGMPMRDYVGRPESQVGTRNTYGHDSPYRLEGNRVAFSMLPDSVKTELTEYRRELEKLPDEVPLARLSRNEQLAYWINLHNVAMIEQIANAYPVKSPDAVFPGGGTTRLDEARFITVAGVAMSPRDIRTRIVYPHWKDPRVIYAFWHGDIGGPSIAREAYSADLLGEQLDYQALEFVNALRGTQKDGDKLIVSRLYDEARPYYFAKWPGDLRDHLKKFAEDDVIAILAATRGAEPRIAELDIADLSKGEHQPNFLDVESDGRMQSVLVDGAVARLLAERKDKLERYYRKYPDRRGRIIVGPGSDQPGFRPDID